MTESLFELAGIEYHWPEAGDRLLTGKSNWPTDADLGNWSRNYSAFVWSFTNAAEELVEAVVSGRQRASRIAWPLLYLYRHAVELALKDCLTEAAGCLGEPLTLPGHHRLKDINELLFQLLAKLDFSIDDASILAFSHILEDLDRFDPSGTAFRYPTDRKGVQHVLPASHVDVVDLQRGAMKLLNFLDCTSQQISSWREI